MVRAIAAAAAFSIAFGASVAVAGDSQYGDDDNEYEGRVEQKNRSYFGFDVNAGGSKVGGVTAYLKYECEGNPDGEGLFEAKDDTLPLENREFDGVVKHTFINEEMRRGPVAPRNLTVIYNVTGKLKRGGEASGTIKGRLKAKFAGGDTAECRATSDGEWKAVKGKDIDAPLPPLGTP